MRQPARFALRFLPPRFADFPVSFLPEHLVNLPFLPRPPPVYLQRFPRTRTTPRAIRTYFFLRFLARRVFFAFEVIFFPLQEQNLPRFPFGAEFEYLQTFFLPRTRMTPRAMVQRARFKHLLCLPRLMHARFLLFARFKHLL